MEETFSSSTSALHHMVMCKWMPGGYRRKEKPPRLAGQHWEGFPSRQTLVRQAQSTLPTGQALLQSQEGKRAGEAFTPPPTISHERV